MKIALIQIGASFDKSESVKKAADYVKKAAEGGADMAILPEMWNCPYANKYFPEYAEEAGGEVCMSMAKMARENNIILVGGSVPECEGDKIFNTSFVYDRNGECIARHRKMHLFDIDVEGGQRFFESDTLTAGDDVVVFDTEFGKIGLAICFDIRFPELFRMLALKGAKMIIVPAAFNMTTGPLHWELSFRLRAVDQQLYTVGVSQARDVNAEYVSYANSIVANPWGKIEYLADEKECMGIVDIDLAEVEKVRDQLPLLKARRVDIY